MNSRVMVTMPLSENRFLGREGCGSITSPQWAFGNAAAIVEPQ